MGEAERRQMQLEYGEPHGVGRVAWLEWGREQGQGQRLVSVEGWAVSAVHATYVLTLPSVSVTCLIILMLSGGHILLEFVLRCVL